MGGHQLSWSVPTAPAPAPVPEKIGQGMRGTLPDYTSPGKERVSCGTPWHSSSLFTFVMVTSPDEFSHISLVADHAFARPITRFLADP